MRTKDQSLLEQTYQSIHEASFRRKYTSAGRPGEFSSLQPTPKPFVDSNQELAKKILSDLFVYFEKQGKQDQFANYIHQLDDEGLNAAYDEWNNEGTTGVGNFAKQ